MKKKRLLPLILTAMISLTACSGNQEANTTAAEGGTKDGEKIELTYWYAWGDKIGENNENLVKQFNESQDKIQVTAEFQGTYDELHAKTQAAVAAKNPPEVTMNEISFIETFAKAGMTQDLTSFVEADPEINMDDFNPGLMGNSYVDGKLYGLPYLRSTPIMYVNKTIFEEAGIDLKSIVTWEDFTNAAKQLTTKDRVGISMPVDIWFFEAFLAQAGGQVINKKGTEFTFNKAAGVEALSLWKNMFEEGTLRIPGGEPKAAADQARQDFVNGKSAMYFSSTADLSFMLQLAEENSFELDTAMMPKHKEQKVPTGGANLVMSAGLDEEKQQAAWEFIKFMTAPEQAAYASEYTGYLPSRISAQETETIQNLYKEKPQFKVAVDQLQYGNARPMVSGYPEVVKIVIEEIQKMILDPSIEPKAALDAAAERANAVIK
ncbi:sn-glycerol 3-phosphate transport system substrate-binding protein [Neobacillus niacini]|uniref:ABC transporter substrate-binding protein n=1 Tax=Neobacillus niacini TaxID=86668 RepID=UPI00278753E3|nr:ABC transporter substrate-binding protein [Neobacillus niacini]MDQ0999661.1 sn-glycerol 3-phosphate transport system substrate-binding protein [Neobacillus niacini]